MFDNLSNRLARVMQTMRGEARLTEQNTKDMLREIRMALIEADVALPVVKAFIEEVKSKAMGQDVATSLNPGQALVGIVHKELTALMGGDLGEQASQLSFASQPPAVILMAGLQGAGKTTTTGKLSRLISKGLLPSGNLKKHPPKKVLVVSADVYRPAAIDQLKSVAQQAGVDFFASSPDQKPIEIARAALDHAKRQFYDVLIVDTAGRLGIDTAMMNEIRELHQFLNPVETLFVVDAMQGQDAVNVAKAFAEALPLTGVVLTKMDGDARGGAALSVRHVTGKPLKFIGVSEKLDGLEPFHPERMAQRILGMGDIVSLVEQVQNNIDVAEAEHIAKKIKSKDKFDLNDFKDQLQQVKKMGSMSSLMEKLPGQFSQMAGQIDEQQADKHMRRTEGIINSMTPKERSKPEIINGKRRQRIAKGAGVPVQEVNKLLKQFEQMQGMMKQFKKGGMGKLMKGMNALSSMGRFMGGRR